MSEGKPEDLSLISIPVASVLTFEEGRIEWLFENKRNNTMEIIGTQIRVESPFKNNAELFNNKDMFPDMEFVVPGLSEPLLLHKGIMAKTSKFVQGVLKAKQTTKAIDENKVGWTFDATNEVDRDALVKVLRLCYDETMTVDSKSGELCAVIAALCRLQVTCLDDVIRKLTMFAVDQAKNDVMIGTQLLKETQQYPECCSQNTVELDKALAEVVLTTENITEHFDTVVDKCLMELPAKYLGMAEYGEPHTQFSEFSVRAQYLMVHGDSLSKKEKEMIMEKCDWTRLLSNELRQLKELDVVGQDVMIEVCNQVLENTEDLLDDTKTMLRKSEKERKEYKELYEEAKEKSLSFTIQSKPHV